ncbi:non-homologous end-joining DNA ligase [Sporomusa termitida]|uniref:DNA ligase (ATP) n=1 Tax=Sporomusa termitida TaxID=2377 RepID=A0A517DUV2_9FIRM|nr:non-homologous end-joining DNA ligase [Sporomusa termitida]QDR81134.1 Multifunctional non-homologous end joining DNA repair protein LigD [Sporomusa termitida]
MPIIKPMLAKPGLLPDEQDKCSFEIKWDGIRALFYLEQNNYKLLSRNLKDITGQYPELHTLAKEAGSSYTDLILDGEIVAFDSSGLPSFSRLQHRMGLTQAQTIREMMAKVPAHYMIFDILLLNGHSLLHKTYSERRALLESLRLDGAHWQTPGYKTGDGREILAASRKLGLEGIIAKRLDSSYQPGKRSGAWLKIKNQHRQELLICGWVPGQGTRAGTIGALLIGYYDVLPQIAAARGVPQQLLYAGKAGTGFTLDFLAILSQRLELIKRQTNPFAQDPAVKNAHFVEPVLIGEFEFTEWTPNHTLRHPSFKGLREDKDPRQVIRED